MNDVMINIVIADDHMHLRKYIRKTLEKRDDICVVAEAEDGTEVVRYLKDNAADLLLLDIEMPVMNGIEVLRQLQEEGNRIKSLILSGYSDRELIQGALDLGAQGYLLKDEAYGHLNEAIDAVCCSDHIWLSEQAALAML